MQLSINGTNIETELDGDTPLLWLLRDELGLNATKFGCGKGLCGACTVHLNGQAVRACSLPINTIGANKITTLEGEASNEINALKQAWLKHSVPQCGYCQVGQLMTATALLKTNSKVNENAVNNAMAGNICRCGTYGRIRTAILEAAEVLVSSKS